MAFCFCSVFGIVVFNFSCPVSSSVNRGVYFMILDLTRLKVHRQVLYIHRMLCSVCPYLSALVGLCRFFLLCHASSCLPNSCTNNTISCKSVFTYYETTSKDRDHSSPTPGNGRGSASCISVEHCTLIFCVNLSDLF